MNTTRRSSLVPAAVAAWFSYLVVDFLTHAVFLSSWWRETGSFWLPAPQLLKMIPFAYVSFALYACGLVWLMARIVGSRPGSAHSICFGAIFGLFVGLVQILANYSVFAMPVSALSVWPLSVVLASTGAAYSAGLVLNASRPWKRLALVIAIAMLVFVLGVVIQNIFFPSSSGHINR